MDYANRDEMEARVARLLARVTAKQRNTILRALGDPPQIERITREVLDGVRLAVGGVLTKELEAVYLDSARDFLATNAGVGVDWNLINRNASQWARGAWLTGQPPDKWSYPAGLAELFTDNRRRDLGDLVGQFYEEAWNMGRLREEVGKLFGPQWAETVAVTEVTRASVEGERAIVAELNAQGIEMTEIWQTNNDDLVCPVCGPRHNKPIDDGWTRADGPPAHPRCRCWVGHELIMPEEEAQ